MKLFLKKILNSNVGIFLRNNLGIKVIHRNIETNYAKTISDAFCWRTDNNFQTYFRFNNILNNFFKIEKSFVIIKFYSKDGKFLKELKILNLNDHNEIIINKNLFNGLEDFGTFYIYHHADNFKKNYLISNRCYVGYSLNNRLPSFVHGNTPSKFKEISNENSKENFVVKSSIFCRNIYKIQKNFKNLDYFELFFSNPMEKKLKLKILNQKYILSSGQSIIIKIKNEEQISFKSNCLFLRPTIFSFKNNFIDVHHS